MMFFTVFQAKPLPSFPVTNSCTSSPVTSTSCLSPNAGNMRYKDDFVAMLSRTFPQRKNQLLIFHVYKVPNGGYRSRSIVDVIYVGQCLRQFPFRELLGRREVVEYVFRGGRQQGGRVLSGGHRGSLWPSKMQT